MMQIRAGGPVSVELLSSMMIRIALLLFLSACAAQAPARQPVADLHVPRLTWVPLSQEERARWQQAQEECERLDLAVEDQATYQRAQQACNRVTELEPEVR